MKKRIALGLTAFGLLLLDGFCFEPNRLKIKHYSLGAGTQKIRLVQLTDIHIGPFYSKKKMAQLAQKVNDLKPDVIVFTGDLYDKFDTYGHEHVAVETFGQMRAPLGKFAVWGNHDKGHMGRQYEVVLCKAGFCLLQNEGQVLEKKGHKGISVAGVDDLLFGKPKLQQTIDALKENTFKVLLMHEPDGADTLKDSGVDLILSGHTHGGQIRIPFVPPVTTCMGRKYIEGFYRIGKDTKLYVSPGIGTTAIPARFCMPPEITVFDVGA